MKDKDDVTSVSDPILVQSKQTDSTQIKRYFYCHDNTKLPRTWVYTGSGMSQCHKTKSIQLYPSSIFKRNTFLVPTSVDGRSCFDLMHNYAATYFH